MRLRIFKPGCLVEPGMRPKADFEQKPWTPDVEPFLTRPSLGTMDGAVFHDYSTNAMTKPL